MLKILSSRAYRDLCCRLAALEAQHEALTGENERLTLETSVMRVKLDEAERALEGARRVAPPTIQQIAELFAEDDGEVKKVHAIFEKHLGIPDEDGIGVYISS